jgi:hypothetical protein
VRFLWHKKGPKQRELIAVSAISLILTLVCVAPANGQIKVGDQLHMTLNGNIGASYEGNFGDSSNSGHNLGFGINGTLDGYYFDPKFLSFQVRPYYDRMQSNAESQSITRGSGIESSIGLFGGSHFPGSISYGRNFSSNSEFRIAGVPSILGDSSGSTFDIAWSAQLENMPTLYANYLVTDSTSTLLGTQSQSKNSSRSFSLNSDYKIGGFSLHGILSHYNTEFLSPSFLTAETINNTSSSTNYGVTATRRLPFSGSLALMWTRTTSENGTNDSANNSYTASAIVTPWRRLVVSETFNYTTNVIAALSQSLDGATGSSFLNSGSGWNAMYMNTLGTLSVGHGLTLSGHLNHRIQHFGGRNITDTQYGGSVNFRKVNRFLGFLYLSVGIVDTATQEGNGGVGLVTNLGLTRKFGRWDTSADVSYSQNTQTLYAVTTTSNYSFGGMLRRKINASTFWSASFRETNSGLTLHQGNNNVSQSFASSFSWNKYSFSGNYSRSDGSALLRVNGTLVATPLGAIFTNDFLTFDARSYGVNTNARFFRTLTIGGGYTNVSSNTTRKTLGTFNNGDRFNAHIELKLRRLNILGGFDRAVQQTSAVPGGPRAINSYYVSLSRWFNLF